MKKIYILFTVAVLALSGLVLSTNPVMAADFPDSLTVRSAGSANDDAGNHFSFTPAQNPVHSDTEYTVTKPDGTSAKYKGSADGRKLEKVKSKPKRQAELPI